MISIIWLGVNLAKKATDPQSVGESGKIPVRPLNKVLFEKCPNMVSSPLVTRIEFSLSAESEGFGKGCVKPGRRTRPEIVVLSLGAKAGNRAPQAPNLSDKRKLTSSQEISKPLIFH